MALFSISAFIIALRETMEAALVVSIILAYLAKTGNEKFRKDVWLGVLVAVLLSIVSAILFQVFFGGFEGTTEKIFEGIVFTLTAFLLSWMIIFMFKQGANTSLLLKAKVDLALEEDKRWSIFALVFVNVFREGIETVLFFSGIGIDEDLTTVFVSGAIGIIITLILAALLFNGSVKLNLRAFFNVTSILLILFAAGLFSHGMHEFQEVGLFGTESAFLNQKIGVDLSGILNDKTSTLGVMLRALFGYQDNATWLELFAYILYWVFIGVVFKKIKADEAVAFKKTEEKIETPVTA